MIQFLFNAVIVIVGVFIIVCLLCLMIRVIVSLLRKLFPSKFNSFSPTRERLNDEH